MKKINVIILLLVVMILSGCAGNVKENVLNKVYKGCDSMFCYTYVFNDDYTGIKDDNQEFTYVIEGNEITLYSDRWENSPVRYTYNSKTKCLERLDKTRTICQVK